MSTLQNDQRYASLLDHFRKATSREVDESEVRRFYEFILSQKNGELIIDSVIHPEGTFAHKVALNPKANDRDLETSTSAEGGLLNLWIYTQLDLKASNIARRFQGSSWGITPGIPVGALFGTLWYNTVDDLRGNCSYFWGSFDQYVYVNFWRGDEQIGVFHAGHVGAAIGGSWGDGDWTEE
ncbi:hypothetical protein F4777DRAFT_579683 [Nemania sp. FL0916]|nr:hypothetical protein F4777DRAFT_579683 [Nemania sp. FL0916]